MENGDRPLPEHLRRELFDGDPPEARPAIRAALLGALILTLSVVGAAWAAGLSVPWPL